MLGNCLHKVCIKNTVGSCCLWICYLRIHVSPMRWTATCLPIFMSCSWLSAVFMATWAIFKVSTTFWSSLGLYCIPNASSDLQNAVEIPRMQQRTSKFPHIHWSPVKWLWEGSKYQQRSYFYCFLYLCRNMSTGPGKFGAMLCRVVEEQEGVEQGRGGLRYGQEMGSLGKVGTGLEVPLHHILLHW